MTFLGLGLGAGISAVVLLLVVALPVAWARGLAALATAALLWALGSVLFSGDRLERGFGAVYLVGGLLAGGVLALPRLLRRAGQEPVWVSLGSGLAAALLLVAAGVGMDMLLAVVWPVPDPRTGASIRAQISQGMSNGIVFAAPVLVVLLSVWAWRSRLPA